MPSTQIGGHFVPYSQSLAIRIVLLPLGLIYRVWTFSVRFCYKDPDGLSQIEGLREALVIMLWHNRLFLAGEWHRRFRKKKNCYGLISGSRDGSWLETFYGWAGIRAIRGSQNRRSYQAMRALIKAVREGSDVGITPDGSRGPKYQAKEGVVALARITKAPILLLSFEYSHCLRLKSWDNFVVPYPFSKVIVQTRLLENDLITGHTEQESAVSFAQKALMEITAD